MRNKKTKIILAAVLVYLFLPAFTYAAGYDFFVDKNSTQATEDGSEQSPWKTIGAALLHIQSEGLKGKAVCIKKGIYPESITIANDAKLIGENESETVIDANGFSNAVSFVSTKSEIKNLTIKNAEATAVIVDKKSKVTIDNCSIETAGKYGVEIKQSSATEKYKFTIKNSEVSESGSQGLYIAKRKISVSNNEIFSNSEEGIDLHPGDKGTVSGNNIHGNSESGIESILSGASLTFKNNHIENNHTQGITVQIYSTSKKGKVKIQRNTIRGNHDYGIRYANYTRSIGPKKFKIFADKYIKLSKNTVKNNDDGDIAYE
ncbi:MAG: right-handed parallel beta-helix repeat-containing protein [Candidatus Moranbacteria bacterium]|nr:right-handed parallel beta-helix repeat-containing protein [Candidatus Moranbacteria bacterium]